MKVTSEQLETLWKALQASPPKRRFSPNQLIEKIVADGWAIGVDVDDLLYSMDSRLNHDGGIPAEVLSNALELPWRSIYWKPNKRQTSSFGSIGLAAADVFELLRTYERLGFQVDPLPLREALLPKVECLEKVTDSELSVIWYPTVRHKCEALTLHVEGRFLFDGKLETLKLETGYKVEFRRDDEGVAVTLTVHAPKYRRRTQPVETLCPECGYSYYKGDPDSSFNHRREHKVRMRILAPAPLPKMIKAMATEAEPELVTAGSPAWKHDEMYERARAFKREMRFDFVQWSPKHDADANARGYLFTGPDGTILGAAAFRWRENETQKWWGLQWVWVCPVARRQGLLRARWKHLRERFGDFHIEGPVSEAMQTFAKAMGDEALMGGY